MKRVLCVVLGLLSPLALAAEDTRQLVKMSPEARAVLRAEMLDFQSAVNAIITALGEGKFADAADTAETQVGVSAMGRHRSEPPNARPGMFMPNEMHAIARNMHVAGSEFARTARTGDTAKALQALSTVTGACVACHRSFRTQ